MRRLGQKKISLNRDSIFYKCLKKRMTAITTSWLAWCARSIACPCARSRALRPICLADIGVEERRNLSNMNFVWRRIKYIPTCQKPHLTIGERLHRSSTVPTPHIPHISYRESRLWVSPPIRAVPVSPIVSIQHLVLKRMIGTGY